MKIATYNFLGDELNKPILIEKLVYQTHYDYSKPHRHNYNEIFFFIKGKGKHMIDFKTHIIKDNSIHLVSSNKVHKVKRDKKSFGYVLMFNNDFLTPYNK
jgi:mannose-6-phosphate isomerase-like protein (cupin superfamily)